MLKWPRFEEVGISGRDFALVFALLFNVFTWSYMVVMLIESIEVSAFNIVFCISAGGACLSGALLSEKVKRLHFLYLWMVFGLFSSLLLIFIYSVTLAHLTVIFILLGISFGLGMPSSLAYLADFTNVGNRGLVSSLIFLAANLSTFPLAILLMTLNPIINAIILAVWRALGLIIFVVLKPKENHLGEERKNISFISVLQLRTFSLYLISWVMFILIDTLEKAVLGDFIVLFFEDGPVFFRSMLMIEPLIAVLFMFVGGFLADRIGRKHVAIYGFVSLGIGYAIVGLAPTIKMAWYFYIVVDGAAAGILLTIFILILWGDLSQRGTSEKYYALGGFPFLVRSIIPLVLATAIASVPELAAFSLASFFLFLAILPLMYAPETLPRKNIERRRLKGYVEQAKKISEKYVNENGGKG